MFHHYILLPTPNIPSILNHQHITNKSQMIHHLAELDFEYILSQLDLDVVRHGNNALNIQLMHLASITMSSSMMMYSQQLLYLLL
jgi:hypothetical protein